MRQKPWRRSSSCGLIATPTATGLAAVITDPLFYLLAVLAVTLLGLSKGGLFGLGVMGIPLMSLHVPPLRL